MNYIIISHLGHGPHIHSGDALAALLLTAVIYFVALRLRGMK